MSSGSSSRDTATTMSDSSNKRIEKTRRSYCALNSLLRSPEGRAIFTREKLVSIRWPQLTDEQRIRNNDMGRELPFILPANNVFSWVESGTADSGSKGH